MPRRGLPRRSGLAVTIVAVAAAAAAEDGDSKELHAT